MIDKYMPETMYIRIGKEGWEASVIPDWTKYVRADTAKDDEYFKDIIIQCIKVTNEHIIPDGISDREAMSKLYGILDNAEIVERLGGTEAIRAAMQKVGG